MQIASLVFYLTRWGGVSPTVEYTVYSGVNVCRDAIHRELYYEYFVHAYRYYARQV